MLMLPITAYAVKVATTTTGGTVLAAVGIWAQAGDTGISNEVSLIALVTGIVTAVGGGIKLFTDHKALNSVIAAKNEELDRKDAEIARRSGEADRLRDDVEGLRDTLQEERELRIQLKQEASAAVAEAALLKAQIAEGRPDGRG